MPNTKQPRQVIVVDKSLNMPPGKLAAQVAHAPLGAHFKAAGSSAWAEWTAGTHTKIIVYVKSPIKFLSIYNRALQAGLPTELATVTSFTFFEQPTNTCVGIGPVYQDQLIDVTDKLRLLP